jgi:hypothetical protein
MGVCFLHAAPASSDARPCEAHRSATQTRGCGVACHPALASPATCLFLEAVHDFVGEVTGEQGVCE